MANRSKQGAEKGPTIRSNKKAFDKKTVREVSPGIAEVWTGIFRKRVATDEALNRKSPFSSLGDLVAQVVLLLEQSASEELDALRRECGELLRKHGVAPPVPSEDVEKTCLAIGDLVFDRQHDSPPECSDAAHALILMHGANSAHDAALIEAGMYIMMMRLRTHERSVFKRRYETPRMMRKAVGNEFSSKDRAKWIALFREKLKVLKKKGSAERAVRHAGGPSPRTLRDWLRE